MEDKSQKRCFINNKKGNGCIIAFFIIFLIIFIPLLVQLISNNIENSNKAKHETALIEEGKVKSASDVMDEIMEILKSKDEVKLEGYLSENFTYFDNDGNNSKYINSFIDDLAIYSTSYEIERRGNDIKDKETYRVYWNVVEKNRDNGIDKTSQYYCLQKITIMLTRVVKEDIITYDIEKIILTDN